MCSRRAGTFTHTHARTETCTSAGTTLPLSQDAFIEKTLPQGVAYLVPSPPSPAAVAEQHLEGRVLKVLYWEVYSWKTLDLVMLESRAVEPAPQLSDRLQSTEHGGRAAARAPTAISAAESLLTITLFPPTTSKGACLGAASDAEQCRYPLRLLPAGSEEQTCTVQPSPLHQPQGGQWLMLSSPETASQQSTSSGHSGPALSNRSLSHQPTWCRPWDQLQEWEHQQ